MRSGAARLKVLHLPVQRPGPVERQLWLFKFKPPNSKAQSGSPRLKIGVQLRVQVEAKVQSPSPGDSNISGATQRGRERGREKEKEGAREGGRRGRRESRERVGGWTRERVRANLPFGRAWRVVRASGAVRGCLAERHEIPARQYRTCRSTRVGARAGVHRSLAAR
eukprot:3588165-Rhodomonas_salina.1